MTIKSEYKYIWRWRCARSFWFNGSLTGLTGILIKGSIVVTKRTLSPVQVPCDFHTDVRRNDLSPFTTLRLTILCSRVHYSLVQIYLNRGPVQQQQCKTWVFFLMLSTSVLMAVLDTVLLLQGTRILIMYSTTIGSTILPTSIRLIQKEYQNLHAYGTASVSLCPGHFIPWTKCIPT